MIYSSPYSFISEILSLAAAISEAEGRLEALELHITTLMPRKKSFMKAFDKLLNITEGYDAF